jgi:excisionase family DNA binding protein
MTLKREWWKDSEDEALTEIQTRAAMDRVFEERAERVRERVAVERKRVKSQRETPVKVGKMHSPAHWAEILGFAPKTISDWANRGELKGYKIKGEWRISEEAVQEFLVKQQRAYAS